MKLFDLPRSEDEAIKLLQERGILPARRLCAQEHEMTLYTGNRARWVCKKKECRVEVGMRVGNWLEGGRLDFVTVLRFIYCWCHEYTSIDYCERELEMNTTVDWSNYMRDVCAGYLFASLT